MEVTRRAFLSAAPAAACAAAGGGGGVREALPPPGTSVARLRARCTACQACVSACPSDVLLPAGREYGALGALMPRMDFSRGWCRPDCAECSKACPAGAIAEFAAGAKSRLRGGVASVEKGECFAAKGEFGCGNCAAHCPYGALAMKEAGEGAKTKAPEVDAAKCTGCGACEYHCPVKAIKVKGRGDGEV